MDTPPTTPPVVKSALFIDVENMRYSLRGLYSEDLDAGVLLAHVHRHGAPTVAYAYADFSDQPAALAGTLRAAGVILSDHPLVQRPDGRRKSVADGPMLLGMVQTALVRPDIDHYVLATGDGDFAATASRLRDDFHKVIVVCGIPGAMSQALADAATVVDPLPIADPIGPDLYQAMRFIDWAERQWEYTTYTAIARCLAGPGRPLGPLTRERADAVLRRLLRGNAVRQDAVMRDSVAVRVVRLNRDHPAVGDALKARSRRRDQRRTRGTSIASVAEIPHGVS